jgi:hypothetical protein
MHDHWLPIDSVREATELICVGENVLRHGLFFVSELSLNLAAEKYRFAD